MLFRSTGGGSITMPHKEAIIPYLDELTDTAKKISAVNTIIKKDGKLIGDNTDWIGIINPLKDKLSEKDTAIILGAGGAARAACYAFNELKIPFFIYNRTVEKAKKLAKEFDGTLCEDLNTNTANILINTLPLTAKISLPDNLIENISIVFDVVYTPYWTPLLEKMKDKKIIHGIEMLLEQGYKQFKLWKGKDSPKEKIIKAIKEKL